VLNYPQIKAAIAAKKETGGKISVGEGLLLIVPKSGNPMWRYRYRVAGKEKTLSLGTYPHVSLAVATEAMREAKKRVKLGGDPSREKTASKMTQAEALADTFSAVCDRWFAKKKGGLAPDTQENTARVLRYLREKMGKTPIREIRTKDIVRVIEDIEQVRGVNVAGNCLVAAKQVFRAATQLGMIDYDPAGSIRRADIISSTQAGHRAAVTDPARLGEVLTALDAHDGSMSIRAGIRLLPLLFVRPGELRKLRWADIHDLDGDNPEWKYLSTKKQVEMIVPLSQQAVAILKAIKPVTGSCEYVLRGRDSKTKYLGKGAFQHVLVAQMGLGEEQSAHGFRATAKTLLREVLGFREEVVEMQLAHLVRDSNGKAYSRMQWLDERRRMMQVWADYLDDLKVGVTSTRENVVPMRAAG